MIMEPDYQQRKDWFKKIADQTEEEKSEQRGWDQFDLDEISEWDWE